jgi:UDP-N-acetylmuramoyl-L-alanyl-D-glutamate--2,6-diaminopimelate ligase
VQLIELMNGERDYVLQPLANANKDITGLTCDSRRVKPGYLFAALPGSKVDGRDFIADAIERGATAVLGPPGTRIGTRDDRVSLVTDDNPRRLFALMAARLYARQPETVVAVTGTNGKTSVVSFLRQMWIRAGHRAASLGTLGIQGPDGDIAGSLTTPDPVDLHESLQGLAEGGVQRLAVEASSHGLDQHRLDGLRVSAAAFTNLTRDHLDYHGSMDTYLAAKQRLFTEILCPGGVAVLNADSSFAAPIQAAAVAQGRRVVSFGERGADVRLDKATPLADGQRLELTVMGRSFDVNLPLVGGFQASNALCALALAVACGENREDSVASLEHLSGARGRLERVARHPNGAPIFVDYAHTPDALSHVLKALRPHTEGRLGVVFGCGGDRDPGKRPQMGAIAAELADKVVVSDDNPRSEDPAEIRHQIMAACPAAQEIGDRAEAIALAIAGLGPDDLLVVAGKGHESGQIVGAEVRPFDDADVCRKAVQEIKA